MKRFVSFTYVEGAGPIGRGQWGSAAQWRASMVDHEAKPLYRWSLLVESGTGNIVDRYHAHSGFDSESRHRNSGPIVGWSYDPNPPPGP